MERKHYSLNTSNFSKAPISIHNRHIRLSSMDCSRSIANTPEFASPLHKNLQTCSHDASPSKFNFFSDNRFQKIRFSHSKDTKRSRLPPLLPSAHKVLRKSNEFDFLSEKKNFKLRRFNRKPSNQFTFLGQSYDNTKL